MKSVLKYSSLAIFCVFLVDCGGEPAVNANKSANSTPTANKSATPASTPASTPTSTTTNSKPANTSLPTPLATATPLPPAAKQDEGQFSFPPPRVTTFAVKQQSGQIPLKDFFADLEAKLQGAGYLDASYYTHFSHGNEFALVTKMEQIDAEGKHLPEPLRWSDYVSPADGFVTYATYLLKGKRAYYRTIAFVVSPEEFNPRKGQAPSFEIAKGWIEKGEIMLRDTGPGWGDGQGTVLNENYRCYTLIYIFQKHTSDDTEKFVKSFTVSAEQQLKQMNISF